MSKYNYSEIKTRYLHGETAKSIADSLGTYNTTIRRILLKQGVLLRGNSEVQSRVNPDKFLKQSDIRDYWLGFIIADGHVGSNEFVIEISVAPKDKEHLQKYADWLGISIKCYRHNRFHVDQYRASFKNKAIHKYLVSLGITPRKSKTIKLDISINSHILRGIIDGDGYVRTIDNRRSHVEIASCSPELVEQIVCFLKWNDIDVSSVKTLDNGLMLVCIYAQKQVKKLYTLIYKDASVFLERKRDRFTATLSWKDGRKNALNSGNQHQES